jgi:glycosyltransferase involved in cell wall biosynthesis
MKVFEKKRLCVMIPGHWSKIMGGAQYQAKCIIEELKKTRRYDIFYLTRNYDPEFKGDGYKLVGYGYPGSQVRGFHRHFFELAILPKILKRIDPDIIYQRVGCAQTGIAAHYAIKHRCRMVWHIASEADLETRGVSFSRLFIYRWFDRYLLHYGIRCANQIIAQTDDQKKLLKKNFNRDASAVIPNLHPLPNEVLVKEGPLKIVWIANLKDLKQPEIFIRLTSELQTLPDVEFIMIGAIQGGNRRKEKYMKLISNAPALRYLGVKRQEEVNTILAQSHILVNTSRHEGLPNTFIQAWFRKMAVVSLHVDPDRLIERQNLGFVSKSFDQLKKDVLALIINKELRDRLGLNAQIYAKKQFSINNISKIIQVFENQPLVQDQSAGGV